MNKINELISQIKENSEFEAKFNYKDTSVTLDLFQTILKKAKLEKGKFVQNTSLDVIYNQNSGNYRITIDGLKKVNDCTKVYGNKPNHTIFSLLASKINNDDISLMKKTRLEVYDDNEFDIRFKLSDEKIIESTNDRSLTSIPEIEKINIFFRFKHRISLIIEENNSYRIVLDLTSVKSSKNLLKLGTYPSNYEIELEFFKKNSSAIDKKHIELYTYWVNKVTEWVKGTTKLITKAEKDEVMKAYFNLLNRNDLIRLYSMQAETLSLPKLTDYLANNYGITDKADGSLCNYFTYNEKGYIITNNFDVKLITNDIKGLGSLSLCEGEMVGDRFLLFDIMFLDGEDIRNLHIADRIKKLDILNHKCTDKYFKFETFNETSYSLDKLLSFYSKQLKGYIEFINLNKKVIQRKFYILCKGIDNSEIFKYSVLMWNEMKNIDYKLDGLIYVGIEQKYTSNPREVEFPVLKWKPEHLNSIDMYIEYVRNNKGKVEDVFDNSDSTKPKNIVFRIMNLFVGSIKDNKEIPIRFMHQEGLDQAYFTVQDGHVRDENGIIVNDKTVVELSYKPDDSVSPQNRWHIIRTRYDKTFNVQQHSKQYGNNENVARKIFDTIINPIRFSDLENLSKDYDTFIEKMKQRVSTKIIEISKQDDAYYQFKTDLNEQMRKYHNYVKDLLFNYYLPKTLRNGEIRKLKILDIGVGRGGDVLKYYHSDVKEVVGIDPDINGLYNASDSAFSRYETQRKKKPYFTKMTFIQASAGEVLESKKQGQIFPLMSDKNKELIDLHLGGTKKFDAINMQFSIHYLFNTQSFTNLLKNINKHLKNNGYVIITTFDSHLVKKYLNGEKEKSEYFTDDNGNKQILFTIKDVSIGNQPGLDQAYDFFTAMFMNEGSFETEYLVYPEFIEEEFKKKCNLSLIDSMSFKDLMDQQETFFLNTTNSESDLKRKKFLDNVVSFYNEKSSLNEASKQFSHLNRYYVFQKRE